MPIETTTWAAAVRRANEGKGGPMVHPAAGRTPLQNPESLETLFIKAWKQFGSHEEPAPEYRFMLERRWRFDWAFVEHQKDGAIKKIAIECDGGEFSPGGGRHAKSADKMKMNHAASLGWIVFHFDRVMLTDDPQGCCELVRRALEF